MEVSARPKVVILGAGFAGVRTALDLAKSGEEFEVILVDKTPFHEFHADLYEVATTEFPESKLTRINFESLRGSVAIPLQKIFKNSKVQIVTDEVNYLDLKSKKIGLKSLKYLDYDVLVLALGSETNYFSIANLEKYSLPLKTVDDALNIRNEIDELFFNSKEKEKIHIVIGGGGFTGCELAGDLKLYVQQLSEVHTHNKKEIDISIVEACPVLINGAPRAIQRAAETRLITLGVDLHLSTKINGVEKEVVKTDKGDLPYDILIWTAGVQANTLVKSLTGVHVEKSCLVVDKTLRVIPFKEVFAIGDIAYCFNEEKSCPVPATAQTAIDQGKQTAKNIIKLLKNKNLDLYRPKMPKFIVPLGGKFAATELAGVVLEGIDAWWLKRVTALKYFSSILPKTEAYKIWSSGNKFFVSD